MDDGYLEYCEEKHDYEQRRAESEVMDRYDQEIERVSRGLSEGRNPLSFWTFGEQHSPLFDGCSVDRRSCFCLTAVRNIGVGAETRELSDAIRSDKRIPDDERLIRSEHLPVFAEWQRRLDKELGRTPPPLLPPTP